MAEQASETSISSDRVVHGASVDVEDYRQILARRFTGDALAVDEGFYADMDRITETFDQTDTRATFFVTGTIVREIPQLVRQWHALGHEIATHGHAHEPLWALTPAELKQELLDCKHILEDTIGTAVLGFRAPVFSVRWDTLWSLETIAECGFIYDTSVVPVRLRRYGVAGFPPDPAQYTLPGGGTLVEIPLSIGRVLGRTVPVAGGGYFRLFPAGLVRKIVAGFDDANRSFIMYAHPYELGSRRFGCVDLARGWLGRLKAAILSARFNLGLRSVPPLVRQLLCEFRFAPLRAIAETVRTHGPNRVLAETCPAVRGAV